MVSYYQSHFTMFHILVLFNRTKHNNLMLGNIINPFVA